MVAAQERPAQCRVVVERFDHLDVDRRVELEGIAPRRRARIGVDHDGDARVRRKVRVEFAQHTSPAGVPPDDDDVLTVWFAT